MEEIILYGLSAAAIILSLRKTDGQMQSVSRQRFRNRHLGEKNDTLSILNYPLICPSGETLAVSIKNPTTEGFPFTKRFNIRNINIHGTL